MRFLLCRNDKTHAQVVATVVYFNQQISLPIFVILTKEDSPGVAPVNEIPPLAQWQNARAISSNGSLL
jgi:signal recognition particle receptor subunit beta